jgi:hypothetical protein
VVAKGLRQVGIPTASTHSTEPAQRVRVGPIERTKENLCKPPDPSVKFLLA